MLHAPTKDDSLDEVGVLCNYDKLLCESISKGFSSKCNQVSNNGQENYRPMQHICWM